MNKKQFVYGFFLGGLVFACVAQSQQGISQVNVRNIPLPVTVVSGSITSTSETNVSATITAASIGSLTNVSATIVGGTANLTATSPLSVVGLQGKFNFQVARDTTAGGIADGYVLAPVVQLDDVAITSTNSVTLHKMLYFSGDATTTNNFKLLICSAPITWTDTNTVFNPVASELYTNLAAVIDSTDTSQGKWSTIGTNRVWYSYGLGILLKPATNSLFLYFVNASAITNVNTAYATVEFFK